MKEFYINLDGINKLEESFNVSSFKYGNNNKDYQHLNYNNNILFVNFKGIIYNLELTPRKKVFIKVDQHTYNNYLELLSIISTNIEIAINDYDSAYLNVDNYYL